jgi:hypothetical protein
MTVTSRRLGGLLAVSAVLLMLSGAGCARQGGSPGLELQQEDYARARSHFKTSKGPPCWRRPAPGKSLVPPARSS